MGQRKFSKRDKCKRVAKKRIKNIGSSFNSTDYKFFFQPFLSTELTKKKAMVILNHNKVP